MMHSRPWGELLTDRRDEAWVLIMSVPTDLLVSGGRGAWEAPGKIRYLSLYQPITAETDVIIDRLKVFIVGDEQMDSNRERYFKLWNTKLIL